MKAVLALLHRVPVWLYVIVVLTALLVVNALALRAEQRDHLKTRTAYQAALLQAEQRARDLEREHSARVAVIVEESQREKDQLVARANRLAASLRNRPQRTDPVPESGSSPVACTGAGLYREDGEFLAGEAARANQLRADLKRCQALYDEAVRLTNQKD